MIADNRPILLLAETGFIIRNLLLGYFADAVAGKKKLLVAVKNPKDELLLDLIKGKNIELIPFPLESSDERGPFKRLFSWDNSIYNLKMVVKDNASVKYQTRLYEKTASKRVHYVNKAFQQLAKAAKTLKLTSTVEQAYLERYIGRKPVTQEWTAILKEHNPCLVFSSMLTLSIRYRCSTDLPAVVAAHKLGIKTCTLVQSWDNLSSKTSVLPAWLNKYYTWSETMTRELLQYNPGINPQKVKIVGSPQYDFHLNEELLIGRATYVKSLGLDPERPYVLVGTGTAKWMPDEMEKMVSLCHAVHAKMPHLQCLIRLHPKDHGERWQPYLEQLNKDGIALQYTSPETHMDHGGFIPPRDFYRDQVNTIFHSAAVINSSSSITVDAAIYDKPVICIAYDLGPDEMFPEGRAVTYSRSAHYSKLTATDGVRLVYSEADCIQAIADYIKNPAAQKAERVKIVETVTYNIHEKAGLTLANEVLALAGAAK
jgi:hypothetical protein